MKKLLSILAIGGGILAFTLPTVTACKSKSKPKPPAAPTIAKLNLNEINVFNIKVTKNTTTRKLQINVNNAFNKIKTVIIDQYNDQKYKDVQTLSPSDFTYGSTTDDTHSWAIKIMDGNNVVMPLPANTTELTNIFTTQPTTAILLPDNALKVKIITTNKNVEQTTEPAIAHAYLNKFLYAGKNINKREIFKNNPTMLPDPEPLQQSLDISKYFGVINDQTPASQIINGVKGITNDARTGASKKIIDFLNTQIATETKTLKDLGVLKTTGKIDFGATTNPVIYELILGRPNEVRQITGQQTAAVSNIIYVRLQNLGLDNYIGNLNSYLYLKIGRVMPHP